MTEARAKHRMVRIGPSFLGTAQPIEFRRSASPKVTMLGENEPHPMASLLARFQLRQRLLEHSVRLRLDEAL